MRSGRAAEGGEEGYGRGTRMGNRREGGMFLRLTRGARRRSIPGSAFELTARGFKTGGLDARRAPPSPLPFSVPLLLL